PRLSSRLTASLTRRRRADGSTRSCRTGATMGDATFGPLSAEPGRSSPVDDDGRAMRPGAPTVKNRNPGYAITRGCSLDTHGCCAHVVCERIDFKEDLDGLGEDLGPVHENVSWRCVDNPSSRWCSSRFDVRLG